MTVTEKIEMWRPGNNDQATTRKRLRYLNHPHPRNRTWSTLKWKNQPPPPEEPKPISWLGHGKKSSVGGTKKVAFQVPLTEEERRAVVGVRIKRRHAAYLRIAVGENDNEEWEAYEAWQLRDDEEDQVGFEAHEGVKQKAV